MNTRLRLIFISSMIIVGSLSNAQGHTHPMALEAGNGLQIVIRVSKTTYRLGDRITIDAEFVNKQRERLDLVVHNYGARVVLGEDLHFIVRQENGEEIRPVYPPSEKPEDITRIPLIPSSYWGTGLSLTYYRIPRPGKYRVQLRYSLTPADFGASQQGPDSQDRYRWIGIAVSNTITVLIH